MGLFPVPIFLFNFEIMKKVFDNKLGVWKLLEISQPKTKKKTTKLKMIPDAIPSEEPSERVDSGESK
jgi:hypothetical protein